MNTVAGAAATLTWGPVIAVNGDVATGITSSSDGFDVYVRVGDTIRVATTTEKATFSEMLLGGLLGTGKYQITLDTDVFGSGNVGKQVQAMLVCQSPLIDPLDTPAVTVISSNQADNVLKDGGVGASQLASALKQPAAIVDYVGNAANSNGTYTVTVIDYDGLPVAHARFSGNVVLTITECDAGATEIVSGVNMVEVGTSGTFFLTATGGQRRTLGKAYRASVACTIDGNALTLEALHPLGVSTA